MSGTGFNFEYVLVSPTGQYYTGMAGEKYLSSHAWDAITYTEQGAYAKIERCSWAKNFTIKRGI